MTRRRPRRDEPDEPETMRLEPDGRKIRMVCNGYTYEFNPDAMDPGVTFFIPTIHYNDLAMALDEYIIYREEKSTIELIATACLTPKGYGVRVIVIPASARESLPPRRGY